jgi:hypothetical protein
MALSFPAISASRSRNGRLVSSRSSSLRKAHDRFGHVGLAQDGDLAGEPVNLEVKDAEGHV